MVEIVLVDDEELVRFGLRAILESDPEIRVVAEAKDGAEALAACREFRPDIVLMDIRMAGMDGLCAARELSTWPDPPKTIMLTTFDLDEHLAQALESGAVGFLLKDTPPTELLAAVRSVAKGHAILSPEVTLQFIKRVADTADRAGGPERARIELLTDRERDVLSLVAEGLSNAQIAGRLFMSESTVKVHVGHLLGKLGAANRVQAAVLAHESGFAAECQAMEPEAE